MKHLQRWGNFILEQFEYPELYKEKQAYKGISNYPVANKTKYVYIYYVSGESCVNCIIIDEKGNIDLSMKDDNGQLQELVELYGRKDGLYTTHGKEVLKNLSPIDLNEIPNNKKLLSIIKKESDRDLQQLKKTPETPHANYTEPVRHGGVKKTKSDDTQN